MAELLLELLSEEIPARMQRDAAEDLPTLIRKALKSESLTSGNIVPYVTPRRLVVVVNDLFDAQADSREKRRGPRSDAPNKAIEGFAKSVGLEREQLVECETDKGRFFFAVIEREKRPTAELLADVLPRVLASLSWRKSMRWGAREGRWVRPLQGILCLLDGVVVPFSFIGVEAADVTTGHRFMAPDPITVTGFEDYRDKLRAAYVMLDSAERREVIEKDATLAAEVEGLALRPDPELVAEAAGLVEWPVVLTGAIDSQFMDLPPEVLTTAMRHHLKHFALLDGEGNLAPRFLVVANVQATDGGKQIVAGNERVLRARLADAKFFWDQDRKRTLETRGPDLEIVIYHAKLGTLGDKVRRIELLSDEISPFVATQLSMYARQAALLCKADLVTQMVGEFPELQGVMGQYYAAEEGKDYSVSRAIAEHYSPQGPEDKCPDSPVSIIVALADKIDTLICFFGIGEKPTGSRDPYGLRRAALGVIRLILENEVRIPISQVFQIAFRNMDWGVDQDDPTGDGWANNRGGATATRHTAKAVADRAKIVSGELLTFFADRLKAYLRAKGVRHDLISAVFALGDDDDLVRLLARVDALQNFLSNEDGEHLLTAYRRAANIVRIEEKRDGKSYSGKNIDPKLLHEPAEIHVTERLTEVSELAGAALKQEEFGAAMSALATLRNPVDDFFDNVTVNCDEPKLRRNRLSLLASIRATLDRVADFSKIEGGER